MKYFIELTNGKLFEIDEKAYNKLFMNISEIENVCFDQEIKTGKRHVCIPKSRILYFYTI
ncbi:MAG: hypothetical protein JJV99_09550 [Colwellia sp.]|nr:hypothetical protein [Colwellia sp.]